jgi:5-carboxymethyl-2-hydroxymuconate isomerase
MPHIHLETTGNLSENVQIEEILARLTEALCRFETIDPASVKAYHTLRTTWVMGEGAPQGFAHCGISVLAGRPEELRARIADALYQELVASFSDSLATGDAGLTLEVREMNPATYRK